jgi:ribose transport system permease protein
MTAGTGRWLSRFGPLLALVAIALAIGAVQPTFLSALSLQTMAMQAVFVALPALGMTFVVVAGGIDISVGSVVAFCAVAAAALVRDGCSPLAAAGAAGLLGAAWGLGNGLLITQLAVAPFIVTLGTMGVARGLAKWLANDQKIDADPGFLADLVRPVPQPGWLLLGSAVWMVVILAALAALLLRRTVFGLHVVAVGSNAQNARLCGVRVERILIAVYVLSGLCAGAVGALQFGELACGVPTAGVGLELQVIAAVVIGGASLSGGEGSLAGALVGALLTVVLKGGCTQLGIADHWQDVLVGTIIVVAVAVDRWRHR